MYKYTPFAHSTHSVTCDYKPLSTQRQKAGWNYPHSSNLATAQQFHQCNGPLQINDADSAPPTTHCTYCKLGEGTFLETAHVSNERPQRHAFPRPEDASRTFRKLATRGQGGLLLSRCTHGSATHAAALVARHVFRGFVCALSRATPVAA